MKYQFSKTLLTTLAFCTVLTIHSSCNSDAASDDTNTTGTTETINKPKEAELPTKAVAQKEDVDAKAKVLAEEKAKARALADAKAEALAAEKEKEAAAIKEKAEATEKAKKSEADKKTEAVDKKKKAEAAKKKKAAADKKKKAEAAKKKKAAADKKKKAEATKKKKAAADKKKASGAAKMTFNNTVHDFDFITVGDKVTHTFKFTNSGAEPLIIQDAKAACGCTIPDYPRGPIAPGESGSIKVTFDSKGNVGKQNKTVKIITNANSATLAMKGFVNTKTMTNQKGESKPGDAKAPAANSDPSKMPEVGISDAYELPADAEKK